MTMLDRFMASARWWWSFNMAAATQQQTFVLAKKFFLGSFGSKLDTGYNSDPSINIHGPLFIRIVAVINPFQASWGPNATPLDRRSFVELLAWQIDFIWPQRMGIKGSIFDRLITSWHAHRGILHYFTRWSVSLDRFSRKIMHFLWLFFT